MTTNYERLLGSPERAAGALSDAGTCWGTLTGEIACGDPCEGRCPMWELADGTERCLSERPEKWREWLEGEAAPISPISSNGAAVITALVVFLIAAALVKLIVVIVSL